MGSSGSRRAVGRLLQARQGAPYVFPVLLVALVLGAGWWLRAATPRLAGAEILSINAHMIKLANAGSSNVRVESEGETVKVTALF